MFASKRVLKISKSPLSRCRACPWLEVRGSDIPPGCAVWSVHSQEFQFLGPLIIPLFRNFARTLSLILGLISGVSANPC